MTSRTFVAGTTALLLTAALAALGWAQAPGAQNTSPIPDKGAFRVLLNGAEVGSEQFETAASDNVWIAKGESVTRVPGEPETRSSGELRISADGTPLGYKWSAQADKKTSGSVEFDKGAVKTYTDVGGKDPYQQDFVFPSPRVAVLDNNLYHQYALLALLYNWTAKGRQTFPVLIPQDITPGEISVESLGPRTVEGATLEALRVNSADVEILAYFDARRRLMRIEVPAAMVAIVRR